MATIKELAHNAAMQIYGDIGISKFSIERVEEIIEEKLTEQNDKACKEFCCSCMRENGRACSYICLDNSKCRLYKDFRKALEE